MMVHVMSRWSRRSAPERERGRKGTGNGRSETFEQGRVRLPAALAHELETDAGVAALELAQERGGEAGTGRAQRMAQRGGAAGHVDPVHVGLHLLRPGQHDAGEGLVDLDAVDRVEGGAGALEEPPGGGDGRGE